MLQQSQPPLRLVKLRNSGDRLSITRIERPAGSIGLHAKPRVEAIGFSAISTLMNNFASLLSSR